MPESPFTPLDLPDRARALRKSLAIPRRPLTDPALSWVLRISDALGLLVSYQLIFWLRTWDFHSNILTSVRFLVVAAVVFFSSYLFDCQTIERWRPRWWAPIRLAMSTGISGLAVGLAIYLVGPELLHDGYSTLGRTVLIPSLVLFTAFGGLVRYGLQGILEARAGRMRWLVVAPAADDTLSNFWRSFQRQHSPGEVTILTAAPTPADADLPAARGTWNDLERHLEQPWTGVILAGGWNLPGEVIEQLMHARLAGARVFDLGEFYERFWNKVPVYHLHSGWFALSSGFALLQDPMAARAKRVTDMILALMLIIFTAPLLALIALAVKLSSPGPVLFAQPRVGLNGRIFTCFKFRTMVERAEEGSIYTGEGDPRVTPLGRFLRKTRLDEVPQFYNVLRGDMAFIGPRAEWTRCVADYEHVIPFYHFRHLVRPGITGWAQVNYSYGASVDDAREKLEYDLYYIKNHSLMLDVVILMRSVKVVLFGRGAR